MQSRDYEIGEAEHFLQEVEVKSAAVLSVTATHTIPHDSLVALLASRVWLSARLPFRVEVALRIEATCEALADGLPARIQGLLCSKFWSQLGLEVSINEGDDPYLLDFQLHPIANVEGLNLGVHVPEGIPTVLVERLRVDLDIRSTAAGVGDSQNNHLEGVLHLLQDTLRIIDAAMVNILLPELKQSTCRKSELATSMANLCPLQFNPIFARSMHGRADFIVEIASSLLRVEARKRKQVHADDRGWTRTAIEAQLWHLTTTRLRPSTMMLGKSFAAFENAQLPVSDVMLDSGPVSPSLSCHSLPSILDMPLSYSSHILDPCDMLEDEGFVVSQHTSESHEADLLDPFSADSPGMEWVDLFQDDDDAMLLEYLGSCEGL